MSTRGAYIVGGIVVGAAVVGAVAVAWKVWQDEEQRRRRDTTQASSDPAHSVKERVASGGADDESSSIRKSENDEKAHRDLVFTVKEEPEERPHSQSKQFQGTRNGQVDGKKKREGKVAPPLTKEKADPSVSDAAVAKTAVRTTNAEETTTAAAVLPSSSLGESAVMVPKDPAKLDDSFVQVTKPETEESASTAGTGAQPSGEAVTPKRKSRRNRRSKKDASVKSPTGTATLLDTSLDVSESSEGLSASAVVVTGGASGVDGDGADNPQDDSNGGAEGVENAGPPPSSSPPPKDLSAIAKSHQKTRKHHHPHRGPKSPAAAAAVKEIQSSTTAASGGSNKKKRNNRNKSGSKQPASPNH